MLRQILQVAKLVRTDQDAELVHPLNAAMAQIEINKPKVKQSALLTKALLKKMNDSEIKKESEEKQKLKDLVA